MSIIRKYGSFAAGFVTAIVGIVLAGPLGAVWARGCAGLVGGASAQLLLVPKEKKSALRVILIAVASAVVTGAVAYLIDLLWSK